MATKGSDKIPAPNAYDSNIKINFLSRSPSFGFGSSKQRAASN